MKEGMMFCLFVVLLAISNSVFGQALSRGDFIIKPVVSPCTCEAFWTTTDGQNTGVNYPQLTIRENEPVYLIVAGDCDGD